MASKESERVSRYWEAIKQPTEPDSLITGATWDILTSEPGSVDYLETNAGGVPALWAVPNGVSDDDPVVLCFHGGGYVGGSMFSHRKMFAHLAKAIGARALVIDYTLLPAGGTYPVPVVEGLAAYRWLLDQGVAPSRIAFAGDSAGGGLALTVQLLARDEGVPLPAAAMLISPWNDLEGIGESLETNEGKDVLFTKDWIAQLAAGFLNGQDPRDKLRMPLYADLRGFGPLYIQVGDQELLLDDSRMLAARAREAGVNVRLEEFPDQQHSFQMAVGHAPEATAAIDTLAMWARNQLGVGAR
jgi:monoterpene epsilon-lactone hydrolase